MKLKLDENLGKRGKEILESDGHDVVTVAEQSLQGSEDGELLEHCRVEDRCLVTLDLDFANPLLFLPTRYPGIAALRLSAKPSQNELLKLIQTFARTLRTESVVGKLWIIEPGRTRIYDEGN